MEIRVAKLEAIIPTLATREDLAVQTASSMDRLDRTITNLRSDFDRKFSEMDNFRQWTKKWIENSQK